MPTPRRPATGVGNRRTDATSRIGPRRAGHKSQPLLAAKLGLERNAVEEHIGIDRVSV